MFSWLSTPLKKVLSFAIVAIATAALPGVVQAGVINPDPTAGSYNPTTYSFVATGTSVTAYFLGKASASNSDSLEVFGNGMLLTDTDGQSVVLNNQTTPTGTLVTYTGITAGSTLSFAILNLTRSATVYSNPTLNAPYDSISGVTPKSAATENHIYSTAYSNFTAANFPGLTTPIPTGTVGTYVGFEDSPYPGADNASHTYYNYTDYSYNDEAFVFTNTVAVPEPTSLAVLGAGLFGLCFIRRRAARRGA